MRDIVAYHTYWVMLQPQLGLYMCTTRAVHLLTMGIMGICICICIYAYDEVSTLHVYCICTPPEGAFEVSTTNRIQGYIYRLYFPVHVTFHNVVGPPVTRTLLGPFQAFTLWRCPDFRG